MKASHWASTGKRLEASSITPAISLELRNMHCNGVSPALSNCLRRLNNDSTNYSHWHEVQVSWQLIDRIENYGPKCTALWIRLDPWDQLHPMISCRIRSRIWFFWENELKNYETTSGGFFSIAQSETKRQIVLPTILSFSIRLLNQAFQEASEAFWMEWSDIINLFLRIQSTSLNVQLFLTNVSTYLELFHRFNNTIFVIRRTWKFLACNYNSFGPVDALRASKGHAGSIRYHTLDNAADFKLRHEVVLLCRRPATIRTSQPWLHVPF